MTCGCGEPVPDQGFLCHGCAARLGFMLRDVGALAAELDVTITKRSNIAHRPGPASQHPEIDPVRMVYDVRASNALDALTGALRSWAANLADDTGTPGPGGSWSLAATGRWLADRIRHIRMMDWAPDMQAEVTDTIKAARRAIDAPPELVFHGHCPAETENGGTCGAELWGPSAATERRCRQCGTTIDLTELRAWYMATGAHIHATAPVIARALTSQGHPLRQERIRKWKQRGLIAPVGVDPATGHELYRLGTVAEVLARMDAKAPHGVLGRKGGH